MIDWLGKVIGNTPLVKLDENIFAKLEFMNFTGSIKDRSCYEMIRNLDDNIDTIIEPTSGNLGISLAAIGKILGYKIIICLPNSASIERVKMIEGLGGVVIKVSGGMQECLLKAEELAEKIPNSIVLNQFANIKNMLAHYNTTGPEIFKEIKDISYFIAGIGTGGTISGAGLFLKEKANCKVIGVKPCSTEHIIQGLGAGFKPDILNEDLIEEVVTISDDDALKGMRLLIGKFGILAGISSGACYMAALNIRNKYKNGNIVIILPDSISRYISLDLL